MKKTSTIFFYFFITIQLQAQLVTTVAGQPEIPGSNNGEAFDATFNNPHGIAVDINGTVYTADRWSHTIRKITLDGNVSTLAGMSGVSGDTDGVGAMATFNEPWGLCVDHHGNVLVADTRNNKIRRIAPDGTVITLAGSGNFGTSNGFGTSSTFGNPTGIECDDQGNIYIADHLTHIIRKIDSIGFVTTIAGKPYQMGDDNGTGNQASFRRPYGLTLDLGGNILVADEWNHKIRKITPDGEVTTVAGDGLIGSDDGLTSTASFNYPWDLTVDSIGNIYVADGYNYLIRKISIDNQVSTYAGTAEVTGAADGVGTDATFSGATAIALSPVTQEIYIGDAYNHLVRKITDLGLGVGLTLMSGDAMICQGEFVELNAHPNIFTTYHFYLDNQIVQSTSSPVFETNNLTVGNHTLQVLAVDNTSNFTSNTISISVTAAEQPTITTVGSTSFFEGDSVILISSMGNDYFWSNGQTTPTITVSDSGIYTVEITDANGCVGISDPVEIIVQYNPDEAIIIIEGETIICNNEITNLTSNSDVNNQWLKDGWAINGEMNNNLEVNASGNYQVQVTHQNGTVVISDPVEIIVLPEFEAEFSATVTEGITEDVFQFQILNTNIIAAQWNFGDNNTSTDLSPSHQFSNEGTFTIELIATNNDGCTDTLILTDYILVKNENTNTGNGTTNPPVNSNPSDIFIPTAFSPNDDGQNDILYVRGGPIAEMTLLIFNQWGEIVFESFSHSTGWNGKMQNQNVQNGTYVYVFDYVDGEGVRRKLSGHVTVIR